MLIGVEGSRIVTNSAVPSVAKTNIKKQQKIQLAKKKKKKKMWL